MYQIILLVVLSLVVIYLLYQNYVIQKEIYKIKNSFDELNNFLDLSIKKTKPKVLDTLSSIKTNDITDNIVTYSNDVKRVKVETTINSEEQLNMKNQYNLQKNKQVELKINQEGEEIEEDEDADEEIEDDVDGEDGEEDDEEGEGDEEEEDDEEGDEDTEELNEAFEIEDDETSEDELENELENELEDDVLDKNNNVETGISNTLNNIKDAIRQELNLDEVEKGDEGEKDEGEKGEGEKGEGEKDEGEKGEVEPVVNETHKNQYSIGKLQKLNVIAIKEIAKNLNIVLSTNGKQKTKEQFIKDILTKK
jgi:hypothetical protein